MSNNKVSSIVFITIAIIFQLQYFANALNEYKVINTEYGSIRGKRVLTLFDEKPYYSYRGVPYARPPINELRFKVKLETFF